jgi:hypothetical protein
MSRGKHSEAQMIGALKQMEAGRKVEGVFSASRSFQNENRPKKFVNFVRSKCYTELKSRNKETLQGAAPSGVCAFRF